jgi:hypothetical protein
MVEMGESSASAKPSDEIWAKLGNPFSSFQLWVSTFILTHYNYQFKFQTLRGFIVFPLFNPSILNWNQKGI